MSTILPRIFGIISFSTSGQYPSGLSVEIADSSGAWLGYSVVNGGFFEIFPNQEITDGTTLTFSIYKGKDLIHEENIVLSALGYVPIHISEGDYDRDLPDDSRMNSSINYAIVKGRVTLGEEYIAGSPLIADTVKVLAKKSLFRDSEIIGTCSVDIFGNYELKIPYRLLYAGVLSSPPVLNTGITKIYLDVTGTEDTLATTAEFALDNNTIIMDIHISDSGYFIDFNDQYGFYSDKLSDFTGLDEEGFMTITIEGERPETETLAYSTGLDIKEILNMVYASSLLNDAGVNLNDGYALIRSNGQSMEVLTGLSPEKIEADLNAAVSNKIISAIEDLPGTISALANKRTELIGNNKTEDDYTIEELLGAILSDAGDVKTFISMNMDNSDMEEEAFWDIVETTFGPTDTLRLQQGLQALAITGFQPEMTSAILDSIEGGSLAEFVAAKEEPDWYDYIDGICTFYGRLCIPISIRGNVTDIHNEVVKHAYAAQLFDLSTNTYATTYLKQQLGSDTDFADCFEDAEAMIAFFDDEDNAGYDLRIDNAWQADVAGDPVLRKDLLALQNLTRLTEGKPRAVISMMIDGIRSSSQVAAMQASEFAAKYGTDIKNDAVTDKIYTKAVHNDMILKQAYTQLMPGTYVDHVTKDFKKDIWVAPDSSSPPYISTSPDLETLFGSMDFCACADCTSMYSPAAYFTDILNFLKTRQGNTIAYTEINRRRPDLINIDLSCKNSNTPLPYIDLVNELLELIILAYIKANVSGESGLFIPISFQTSGLAKDLAVYPEHTYKDMDGIYQSYEEYAKVYDLILSKAIYPNTLPFNLALEESRVYFSHLGYSRYTLMDLYKPVDYTTITDANLISEYNLGAEWLCLSRVEADIITRTSSPAISEWLFYGFPAEINSSVYWYDDMCNDLVSLLKRCNITYKELLQLLVTDYLNKESGTPPIRPFAIVSKAGKPVDSCQIEDLMLEYRSTVSPPDDGTGAKKVLFRRLHRFIRLQRATGWSIYQLDIVLNSLDSINTDINVDTFKFVSNAHQWCHKFKLSPEEVCVLWSTISTKRYINFDSDTQDYLPSFYDRLFKNKAILNPTDPNFENPDSIIGDLETNQGSILAAFNMSAENLESASTFYTPGGDIDLIVLSKIYWQSIIAKAYGFDSIRMLNDSLAFWTTQIPIWLTAFSYADLIVTFKSVFSSLDGLKESPFNIYERMYLFTENQDPTDTFLPKTEVVQPFYENLRLLLRNQYNSSGSTYNEDLLKQTVYLQFAANFNLDYAISVFMLDSLLFDLSDVVLILDKLIDPAFIESTEDILFNNSIPGFHFWELYYAYYRADKITRIVNRLNLSIDELTTLQEHSSPLGSVDFRYLPIGDTNVDMSSYFNLIRWVRVRDIYQLTKEEFVKVLLFSLGANSTDKSDWAVLICQLTQWSNDDLEFLVGPDNFANGILDTEFDSSPYSFRFATLLLQIFGIMRSSDKMGLRPKIVFEALKADIVIAESQTIRKAAKAKYSDDDWLALAKPLQDQLRIGQRDALVAYVIAHPTIISGNNMLWDDKNDLFAYLLIDVEMEPCMKTSRIKQGISTLQLFIDRIILNIERVNGSSTAITMTPQLMEQWQTWRKWYRVWEANRKIFLYPENWIVPELRDNKTELFKAMETQLLQNDLTGPNVEVAYRAYLEGLDELSRLEPVCSYHEQGNGNDIIHVLSRTDMAPQRYYYRRFEDNEWTSWERINVDVKGDQISLTMWNNRLYVFWLTFQAVKLTDNAILEAKKAERFTAREEWVDAVSKSDDTNAYNKWNISLNWSSYLNGKWVKSDMSKDTMVIDVSKMLLNNNATQSYSNASYSQSVLQILTKRGEITNENLFKNRLYLYTPYESSNQADGITFSIVFAGGLDEKGDGIHSFLWKGDNSRDPYVLRNADRSAQLIAPLGTRFNKMKFEEDPTQDGKLKKDSYSSVIDGYYSYSLGSYVNNATRTKRSTASAVILNSTPYPSFRVTARSENKGVKGTNPMDDNFFFDDERNTYFVRTEALAALATKTSFTGIISKVKVSFSKVVKFVASNYNVDYQAMPPSNINTAYQAPIIYSMPAEKLHFYTFYHPQSPQFISALNTGGISGLITLANQSQADGMHFATNYQPTALVNTSYPASNVQFGYSDAYSIYNWELFFHTPMLIAEGLMNNLQFEDAQKWMHYIFNPTSNTDISGAVIGTNQRFWKFYPFYELSATSVQTLNELLIDINNNVQAAVAQVRKWEDNPFQPHVIARMRILAYMKYVLMKYLDNLIAWGDQLFKRDTIESINEATQLYILAANILGDRPVKIPPRVKKDVYTFAELIANGPLDALSNAMVAIESFYAPNAAPSGGYQSSNPKDGGRDAMNMQTLYFCLPPNDKLLGYWDTIADRLFKIRNCMNIDGIVQQLPLFEPPIDPALLVRAAAMGVNINTILDDISMADPPLYRFTYMVQKSNEITSDVKALGNALLSAIEKKDAEALSLLRSGQEIQLLDKITFIKEKQISDAQTMLASLQRSRENAQIRNTYYTSRPFKNANEEEHLKKLGSAKDWGIAQGVAEVLASILSAFPTIHVQALASGFSGGGLQAANVCHAISAGFGIKVGIDNIKGTMAVTTGGYERRRDDWGLQANIASKDIQQIDQQILGAQIKIDIANRDLSNHLQQIENAQSLDTFMRGKFSNVELYNWMISQISATYFQSYQLAYDMAKRTEWCYSYELPVAMFPSTGFIKFGYWDSLRKGLLAGDKLQFDLRKMESTYIEENVREFELAKNYSLAIFDPVALLSIKRTGSCNIDIPEALFDLDYPGHYMRRIKSVSISIPCIAGPYTTINCELRLMGSKFRKKPTNASSYPESPVDADTRFQYYLTESGAIATSTGQNDSGVFELNFRDERYLPFEGMGAISSWSISFPEAYRQFDYESINDVIIHIKYSSREDGILKTPSVEHLDNIFDEISTSTLARYFSLRHEYSNEWFAYSKAFLIDDTAEISTKIDEDAFPFYCKGKDIRIQKFHVMLNPKMTLSAVYKLSVSYPVTSGTHTVEFTLNTSNGYYSTSGEQTLPNSILIEGNSKTLQVSLKADSSGDPVNIDSLCNDILIVMDYCMP